MPKMSKNLMLLAVAVSLIIGVALVGGCVSNEPQAPTTTEPQAPTTTETQAPTTTETQIIESITPQEAFTLILDNRDNPDFVILDVRTLDEFIKAYIEGAVLIDYYSETFRDELNKLDKGKTYLIYCRSGGRSGRTLPIMEELGFREVYDISGGILAWQQEGLPVLDLVCPQEG